MTKVSNIFDKIDSVVSGQLPLHIKMSNPYVIEDEADIQYEQAYGIRYADGTNLLENINAQIITQQRNFDVVLSRKTFALKRSSTIRETAEKNLFEDQFKLLKFLENDPHLGDPVLIVQARYVSDGGIEFVRVGNFGILILNSIIQVEYHSDATVL